MARVALTDDNGALYGAPATWAEGRFGLKGETTKLWDDVLAALDMREQRGVVIAQASDSTGDANTEYFELAWKAAFADVWPERPARVKRWSTAGAGSYSAWEAWQTGDIPGTIGTTAVYADDFSTDTTSFMGSATPDVGSVYSEFASHGSYWSIAGGKLTRGGPDDGVRATVRATWNARQSPDFDFTGKVLVPAAASNVNNEIMVASNTEATARVNIEITGTGVATLKQYFDATATTLGTFPAGTYTGVEVPFQLKLAGTTLTAVLAGNTLTATLTQPQVDILATTTKTVVRAQIPGTKFDDFQVTATATTPDQPASVPGVDVYNGGAAGQTAQYQRTNLAAMYPVRPDVLFINHGHNYDPTYGWTTPQSFLDSVQGLVDDLEALYPGDPLPVVVTSQNPQFGSGREVDHLAKMKALRSYAAAKGWGYVPTFEAFAARPDGGQSYMQDALHPAVGTGRVLQGDVAESWIKAQSERV